MGNERGTLTADEDSSVVMVTVAVGYDGGSLLSIVGDIVIMFNCWLAMGELMNSVIDSCEGNNDPAESAWNKGR